MERGLYDKTLASIFPNILNNNNIPESYVIILPADIINEIQEYLNLAQHMRFYKSVNENRDISIVKIFMGRLLDDVKFLVLHHGLIISTGNNNTKLSLLIANEMLPLSKLYRERPNYLNNPLPSAFLSRNPWKIPFINAIKNNNIPLMKFFMENGANYWNEGLVEAVKIKNQDLINYFIEKGAFDWDKALSAAASIGDISLMEFFINNGANKLNDALIEAIKENNQIAIKFLLDKNIPLVTRTFNAAVRYKNKYIFKIAIENGIRINVWDKALKIAVSNNDIDMINFLVENGKGKFIKNVADLGLIASVKTNNIILAKYFIKLGANDWEKVFSTAIINGNINLVRELKDKYVVYKNDINIALLRGHYDIIDELLPQIPKKYGICGFGPVIKYFVNNIIIGGQYKKDIRYLFPALLQGYSTPKLINQIIFKYSRRNGRTKTLFLENTLLSSDNLLNKIFGEIPALYDISIERNEGKGEGELYYKIPNINQLSTYNIIKKLYRDFNYKDFSIKYLDLLIDLNIFEEGSLNQEIINALESNNLISQVWKENFILENL